VVGWGEIMFYIYVYICRVGLRHVGAPDRLIIWHSIKLICFKLFWRRIGRRTILRACAQIADYL